MSEEEVAGQITALAKVFQSQTASISEATQNFAAHREELHNEPAMEVLIMILENELERRSKFLSIWMRVCDGLKKLIG